MPFQKLLTVFLQQTQQQHPVSYPVYRRLVEQYFSQWKGWPTTLEIDDWHRNLKLTPHHANKGLVLLKAAFNYGLRRGLAKGPNPATGIKPHRTMSRDRVLTSQEVALILSCLDMMWEKLAAILQVMLTTGCRLSEAREMKKADVNMATGQWMQPRTKNGRAHVTYLPIQAREALAKLSSKTDYFFAGAYEHCWSRPAVEKTWGQTRGALGMKDVRLHDFRRTFATHLYHATLDEYLVKRCINHVNPSITAIYVRIRYEDVAKAMQTQADRFYGLVVTPPPSVACFSLRDEIAIPAN